MAEKACLQPPQEQDDLFVVGTEEGCLHKCSAAFNAEYVATYAGHEGAVYGVAWNRRHTRMFLSASADWTLKLWHDARPKVRPYGAEHCFTACSSSPPPTGPSSSGTTRGPRCRAWPLLSSSCLYVCQLMPILHYT